MSARLRRIVAALSSLFVLGSVIAIPPAAGSPARRAFVEAPVVKGVGLRSALVHVRTDSEISDGLEAARDAGLDIGTRYDVIKVFVAYGTPAEFQLVARNDAIEALEANRRVGLFTSTSHKATRGQEVLDGRVTMPDGTVIDGSGIGVAVIDSGIDGTHPDLENRMGGNVKIICTAPQFVATSLTGFTECLGPKAAVPLPDTDHPSGGGHGTHVAGTVAGDGTASGGKYHGAAPGATLFGVSVGTTLLVENGLDGLAWVLANHDQVAPAIKVVNNSWGSDHAEYDPENAPFHKATWKLQDALIAEGVTVVWAAGNASGTGATSTIGGECVNPTPGLICVANYDDDNTGTRNGSIDSTSSRGKTNDPKDWPDVSAPGTEIIATCRLTLPVCNAHFSPDFEFPNHYAQLSGTSMASPHVAGIVAQLLQANSSLTPAQVEDILEDTAHKFTWGAPYVNDPYNPDDTTSFEKGHGLVDVVAAVSQVLGQPAPEPTADPTEEPATGPAARATYYLHGDTGNNNVDRLGDVVGLSAATFDTNAPTGTEDATAIDTPARSGNGTAVYDVSWAGKVRGTIYDLTLDLWTRTPRNVAQGSTYTASIWVGTKEYQTPAFTIPPGAQPAHFTQTFNTLTVPDGSDPDTARDIVPMEIAAGAEEIWFQLWSSAADAGATVLFDSAVHASGFSVNQGAVPTPTPTTTQTATPTQTPTSTPTTPPSAGGRGTYPTTPNDPYYGVPGGPTDFTPQQWGMHKIRAAAAWQERRATGYEIRVGVLDSGVDLQHEDLQCTGKLDVVPGADVVSNDSNPDDEEGHGTHVAGIIGACTNNDTGVVGVAPDATLVPIRVLDETGSGTDQELIAGLNKAREAGVHVVNMSLGYIPGKDIINNVAPIDAAIEAAKADGIVLVAAAGNDGSPLCDYPALAEDIICVAASDPRDLKAAYSTFATKFDNEDGIGPGLVAPGGSGQPVFCDSYSENVLSTVPLEFDEDGCTEVQGYQRNFGSSMASPHVAGVAALVYDRLGGVRSAENARTIIDAIINGADDLGTPGWDPIFGYGRLNALGAVQAVEAVPDPVAEPAATTVEFTDNSEGGTQFSDDALVEARLTSESSPLANAELVFELAGPSGTRDWKVTTDDAGIASRRLNFRDEPGSYQLTVRYAGVTDTYLPSADTASFAIAQDDSATVLEVLNGRNDRQLRSSTTDADSGTGLAGQTVTFSADGVQLGTAITGDGGVAVFDVPKKYTKKGTLYEVSFAGDTNYVGSSDRRQT